MPGLSYPASFHHSLAYFEKIFCLTNEACCTQYFYYHYASEVQAISARMF